MIPQLKQSMKLSLKMVIIQTLHLTQMLVLCCIVRMIPMKRNLFYSADIDVYCKVDVSYVDVNT